MRNVRHRRTCFAVGAAMIAVLGLMLATGCSLAPSDDGSTARKMADTNAKSSAPRDEAPRDDLTSESVISWSRYERISTNQIRFFYTGGDPACQSVRLALQETDTAIRVAIIVGTIPGAPAHCTMVGRLSSVMVTTTKPVGTRTIAELRNPPLHP